MFERIRNFLSLGEPEDQSGGDKALPDLSPELPQSESDSSEQESREKDRRPLLPDPGPVGSDPEKPGPKKPEDTVPEIDTSGFDLSPGAYETDEPEHAFTTPGADFEYPGVVVYEQPGRTMFREWYPHMENYIKLCIVEDRHLQNVIDDD